VNWFSETIRTLSGILRKRKFAEGVTQGGEFVAEQGRAESSEHNRHQDHMRF
jgi:hypothetical protein